MELSVQHGLHKIVEMKKVKTSALLTRNLVLIIKPNNSDVFLQISKNHLVEGQSSLQLEH
jgi:hypothetical protein